MEERLLTLKMEYSTTNTRFLNLDLTMESDLKYEAKNCRDR
jgi:hypothetical protein